MTTISIYYKLVKLASDPLLIYVLLGCCFSDVTVTFICC